MNIKNSLKDQITAWEKIGFPAIMERFVAKNGESFQARTLPTNFKRGLNKQCFANAGKIALEHNNFIYSEGFAIIPGIGLPFHHAWLVNLENQVVDPTWENPELCEYFGITFTTEILREQLIKNEYWGLLANGFGANINFLHQIDPEFIQSLPREIAETIQSFIEPCVLDKGFK